MSPTALLATSAYGTDRTGCRGLISASFPMVTPRKSVPAAVSNRFAGN
jgi:hypothetical protein